MRGYSGRIHRFVQRLVRGSNTRAILFAGAFALAGITVLFLVKASSFSLNIEPEDSSLSGNVSIGSDSNASGGQYITFGGGPISAFSLLRPTMRRFIILGIKTLRLTGATVTGRTGEAILLIHGSHIIYPTSIQVPSTLQMNYIAQMITIPSNGN